jgi:hypothetical protein
MADSRVDMSANSTSMRDKPPKSRASSGLSTKPPSGTPQRVTRLKTLDDVRVELAKVYREARTHRLPLDEAKGLAYLLQLMSNLVKDTALEQRVAALEGAT